MLIVECTLFKSTCSSFASIAFCPQSLSQNLLYHLPVKTSPSLALAIVWPSSLTRFLCPLHSSLYRFLVVPVTSQSTTTVSSTLLLHCIEISFYYFPNAATSAFQLYRCPSLSAYRCLCGQCLGYGQAEFHVFAARNLNGQSDSQFAEYSQNLE